MKKQRAKIHKNEDGQALIMVVLAIVVLMGIAALVVDVGILYVEKANMQKAADAAALAGAKDLPNVSAAENTARNYGQSNGADITKPKVTSDKTKIEVECIKNVQFSFARVLGFTDVNVSARAAAKNTKWAGDALPFINADGSAEKSIKGESLSVWNKVDPGSKERIHNDDLIIGGNSIKVKIDDGFIQYKNGKDMSEIKNPLMNILVAGNKVYVISIKNEEMPNYAKKGSKELGNKDQIPCADTVLLECEVIDGFSGTGSDKITLKFINSYDWSALQKTYLSVDGQSPGGSTKLVE